MLSSKFDKFLLNNQNIQFKSEDITVYCNSFILKKCSNSSLSSLPLPPPLVQVSMFPFPSKVSTTPRTLLSHTSSTSSRTSQFHKLTLMEVTLKTSLLLSHNHQSATSPSIPTTPITEPSSLLMVSPLT